MNDAMKAGSFHIGASSLDGFGISVITDDLGLRNPSFFLLFETFNQRSELAQLVTVPAGRAGLSSVGIRLSLEKDRCCFNEERSRATHRVNNGIKTTLVDTAGLENSSGEILFEGSYNLFSSIATLMQAGTGKI